MNETKQNNTKLITKGFANLQALNSRRTETLLPTMAFYTARYAFMFHVPSYFYRYIPTA